MRLYQGKSVLGNEPWREKTSPVSSPARLVWPGERVGAAKVQHDLLQSHLALLVKELATDSHRASEILPWELRTWEGREASHYPSPLLGSKSKLQMGSTG